MTEAATAARAPLRLVQPHVPAGAHPKLKLLQALTSMIRQEVTDPVTEHILDSLESSLEGQMSGLVSIVANGDACGIRISGDFRKDLEVAKEAAVVGFGVWEAGEHRDRGTLLRLAWSA